MVFSLILFKDSYILTKKTLHILSGSIAMDSYRLSKKIHPLYEVPGDVHSFFFLQMYYIWTEPRKHIHILFHNIGDCPIYSTEEEEKSVKYRLLFWYISIQYVYLKLTLQVLLESYSIVIRGFEWKILNITKNNSFTQSFLNSSF